MSKHATGKIVRRVVRTFALLCSPTGTSKAELMRANGYNYSSATRHLQYFRENLTRESGLELQRVGRKGHTRFRIRPIERDGSAWS